jgi:hypothetical protein
VSYLAEIFVFGSNLAGRHGKGAAKEARMLWGAIYGQGVGLQGFSYAIPTKSHSLKPLPLETIKCYVDEFKEFAKSTPEYKYFLTAIGCGLAGYKPEQIGPMFQGCTPNVILPNEFKPYV